MEYACGLFLIFLVSVCSASRDLTNPCGRMRFLNHSIDFAESFRTAVLINPPYFFINCSERGLTKVPGMLSIQVEVLELQRNSIRKIKVGDFNRYVRLTALLLGFNCVRATMGPSANPPCHDDLYIEPGALEPLHQLRYLDISVNYLRQFPLHLPSSITGLDISMTDLGDVTGQLRDELPNLTTLIASTNCARGMDQCPRNFTISSKLPGSLRIMDISENNWHEIPSYLFGSNLASLNLFGNQIGKIGKDDFKNATGLESLIALKLASTVSLSIEAEASDPLTKLRYLDLSVNHITYIPHGLFKHTTKLEYLDLSINCLQKILFQATFLTSLSHLKYLDVSANAACGDRPVVRKLQLANEYSNLKSLEYLMVGYSPEASYLPITYSIESSPIIYSIDSNSFAALSGLNVSVISLAGCSLKTIDGEAFKNMTKLGTLYLSHNDINPNKMKPKIRTKKSIDRILNYKSNPVLDLHNKMHEVYDIIFGIGSLPKYEASNHVIDYSHNQITSVSKNQVVLLKDVISLDLSYNQIKFIRKNDFANLQDLGYIKLDYNPLQLIDRFAFETLHSLKGLSFTDPKFYYNEKFSFLGALSREAKIHLTLTNKESNAWYLLSDYAKHNPTGKKFSSIFSADFSSTTFLGATTPNSDIFLLFPSLVRLSLKSCDIIDDVTTDLFAGLLHLKNLDLSHNLFNQLPTALLEDLSTLTEIDLSYNHITILTKEFFANRAALERLYISNNKISNIEPGSFIPTRLRYIDLSSNYIQLLGADILSKGLLESLIYFDIRWNELDCSCQVWGTFYLWYISDESERTTLPGFMPTCTPEIDEYFGGCVACQSPLARRGRSVTRYGHNTSCEIASMSAYAVSFIAFIVALMLCGTIGYSKWFKRFVFRKVNDQFRVQSVQQDIAPRKNKRKINRYHSFVFYDHENPEVGDWVDFHLIPKMKRGKPPIDMVVVGRDHSCGFGGGNQVLRRAMQCHKTIVILSEDFCDTPVCRFLISALQELQYSGGEDRLILVTWYGDRAPRVPELIQRTMNRRRYCFLRFDHANDDEVLFFETLRTHLVANNELS